MPELGDRVRVQGLDDVYVVCGLEHTSKRFWLCVERMDYDGYNGDIILQDTDRGLVVSLADERNSLPYPIVLQPAH